MAKRYQLFFEGSDTPHDTVTYHDLMNIAEKHGFDTARFSRKLERDGRVTFDDGISDIIAVATDGE